MTPDQIERFNRGQKALLRLIEETAAGAREMCEAGESDVSGDLWVAHGHLSMAYGVLRKCRDNSGGPVVQSGGK